MPQPQRRVHKTARCIIARNGSVLVMRGKGEEFCHCPGGHIDPGEQALDALIREIREELGPELGYIKWPATIENDWDNGLVHEIMDLYAVQTYPLSAPLRAREAHLTAFWVQWYLVESVNLRSRQVYPWIAKVAGAL